MGIDRDLRIQVGYSYRVRIQGGYRWEVRYMFTNSGSSLSLQGESPVLLCVCRGKLTRYSIAL